MGRAFPLLIRDYLATSKCPEGTNGSAQDGSTASLSVSPKYEISWRNVWLQGVYLYPDADIPASRFDVKRHRAAGRDCSHMPSALLNY